MSNGANPLAYFVLDTEHHHDVLAIEKLAQRCGYAVISSVLAASYPDAIKILFDNGQWRIHLDTSSAIVSVDFSDPRFYARVNSSALPGEYVVRAVLGRKKTTQPLTVLDATAGFGHDAFLLAAAGCQVTLAEQVPLLAYLLEQAVQRARNNTNNLLVSAAERMTVVDANSIALMQQWSAARPDVVYLDPMYAHADIESKRGLKKSAAVKKNMAFLQRLTTRQTTDLSILQAGHSDDSHSIVNSEGEGMIEAALALAKRKVVVKRAPGAEWLGGLKPASSLTGKATRFDIYPLS
ncbi:class I SAM-dependent methyltransferase [Pseudomonadales bacterium]|nr:class I SAM-dependent methyltransferase [Pseudomonadales bacterium]